MKTQDLAMKEGEVGHNVLIMGNVCYRCNHKWLSYDINEKPKVCPSCKSPYWDRPRKKPLKVKKK